MIWVGVVCYSHCGVVHVLPAVGCVCVSASLISMRVETVHIEPWNLTNCLRWYRKSASLEIKLRGGPRFIALLMTVV